MPVQDSIYMMSFYKTDFSKSIHPENPLGMLTIPMYKHFIILFLHSVH